VSGLGEREVAALLTRAQTGDQAAIHALILEFQPRVRNLVRYLVRGDDQVDDLAQQSLLVAFERLAQFRGEGRFEAWLDGIALRVTLRGMKRVRLWRARQSDAAEEEIPEPPSHDLSRFAERQRAVEALDRLPHKQRVALVMHHVLGMSAREIAELEQIPEETARSRLKHGMALLRTTFGMREEPT
jgi:RNA polymerase sigma-70 factor (ECF subfamily)